VNHYLLHYIAAECCGLCVCVGHKQGRHEWNAVWWQTHVSPRNYIRSFTWRLASAHWRHLANTVHQSVQQCSLSQFQFILYYKLLCCPVVDILGHNTCTTQILSTVECSVACLCIYVLLSITSKPCKMAELIKMPFGVQVYGPRQPSI